MAIHKIKIFAGRATRPLAEKIAASFGTTLGQSEILNFSDGEFQPTYNESIRGCTVFCIQSTFPPTDNLMELLMMIDAAKRAGADYAVDVYPYYGSDVEATLRAGFDILHGLIGPGVYASHGYERSHIDGVFATLQLLAEYVK